MAPIRKHTKEKILEGAFNFVREKGYEKISARRIANYLNASTAPIYSNFKSMEELEEALEEKSIDTLKETLMEVVKKEKMKLWDLPLKYIEFAFDEKNLFNQISKSKKSINNLRNIIEEEVYVRMLECIKNDERAKDFTSEELQDVMIKTWLQAHGIATFLDRDRSKEENLKQAETLLKESTDSYIYAIKNKIIKN